VNGAGSPPTLPATGTIAEVSRPAISRLAWPALVLLVAVHILDSVDYWLLPSLLLPISQDLNLSAEDGGWLTTALLLGYGFGALAAGYLVDRMSRPRLLAIGIAAWSLATVATGLARSMEQIGWARVLVGMGGATFGVIALTLLVDLFPRHWRARILSVYLAAVPLGAVLGMGLGTALARSPSWPTAFLIVGAPGLVLALLALLVPDPIRGVSEGIDERRLRLHEYVGPSREDYIDLMVNSSMNYSVFGLVFAGFAISGLLFWLPGALMVIHRLPAERVGLWLGLVAPAAMFVGILGGGWLADRSSRRDARALFLLPGVAMLAAIPCLLLSIYGRGPIAELGVLATILLVFAHLAPCYAIIAGVVMPNMRGVGFAVALSATHLLGELWAPEILGWVADTFGQADSMATSFGRALAALGAVPMAQPGHDPENLVAALLASVPALLLAGLVLLSGTRHVRREMALMLARLRAAPAHHAPPTPNSPRAPGPVPDP
jgi:MFS family permease